MPRKGPGRPRKYSYRKAKAKFGLKPQVAKEIGAIILIISGLIFLLSLIGAAGSFGEVINRLLRIGLGYPGFLLPLFAVGAGVGLWRSTEEEPFKTSIWLGIILFFLSLTGFIHLFVNRFQSLEIAQDGLGGGLTGYAVSSLFLKIIEFWGSLFILLGLIMVAIILTFNISFSQIGNWFKRFKKEGEPAESKQGFFARFRRKPGYNQPANQAAKMTVPEDASWSPPGLDLLDDKLSKPSPGDIKRHVEIIKKTLANFGIEVAMGDVNIGPTVAQYTLKPAVGVKLNQITARANDLSLALAAHPIRIEAPIPGRSAAGIEVPNKVPALVRLREMLSTPEFESQKLKLAFPLGRDVAGIPVVTDVAKMPHLLIAGSTGSGKSICIHSIILTLLFNNSPNDLKFVLIDPKRVELPAYEGIPHLLTPPIVDHEKTINALKWVVLEMDRRYKLLSEKGKKDIEIYNRSTSDKIPYLIVIIDELADLMAMAAREVEGSIVRMAQMARAVGIHLIVATQRPSVDVLTGLIKANITSRIAFATASQVDSRTILDMAGAEKLLGNGDMLYLASDIGKPKRIQGVFVSEKEIKNVVDFLKTKGQVAYNEEVISRQAARKADISNMPEDELLNDAIEVVVQAKKASASLLQRRLRVGYARAARLLDILEDKGVVGPQEGSKPRDVLIDERGKYQFEDH